MRYVAVDLGASNGRVIVATLQSQRLELEEIWRFENKPISLHGRMFWDFLSLFDNVKTGLKLAFSKYGDEITSIGVDTWGVDYGLIGRNGHLLSNPVCYRDSRTNGMVEEVLVKIDKSELYQRTGLQTMQINTLFQLLSSVTQEPDIIQCADKLLFMPDLFNYFLTGKAVNEYTEATTSQLFNPRDKAWDISLFESLGIPMLMQNMVFPPTLLGMLSPHLVEELGGNAQVVAVGSHDTASAVVAANMPGAAFISSGTWSLMGVKIDDPILTKTAFEKDFSNEGIGMGKIGFLKNITGLWLLQSLVREWKESGSWVSYESLLAEASRSSCLSTIDVDDARLVNPIRMSDVIDLMCRETEQEVPCSMADYAMLVCRSLACKYSQVKQELEECIGQQINIIQVIGGGSQNELLNRLTAEACCCQVVAGPVEATAIGNVITQAIGMGDIDAGAIDSILNNSFRLRTYHPWY